MKLGPARSAEPCAHTRRPLLVAAIAIACCLAGCSYIRAIATPDDANLLSGAGSLVGTKTNTGKVWSSFDTDGFEQINIEELLKDYSLDKYKGLVEHDSEANYRYQRNNLQDRIIAASNQRCGAYLRTLVASKAQTQVVWGDLSALLTGAAAVTTPVSTAKALAAAGAFATYANSNYNDAYFSNLTTSVIAAGISRHRQLLLERINADRQQDLQTYPVNRAIADALTYHSACNIVSGLETAAAATKSASAESIAGRALSPAGAASAPVPHAPASAASQAK